jgi:hypothetical protein
MMADNEQVKEGGKKEEPALKRRRKEDYYATYAENVNVETSLFDIRVTVGEIVEATDAEILFEDRLSIIFSPQHAKAFLGLLVHNLKKYEAEFGEIKLPEDMLSKRRVKKQPEAEATTIDATEKPLAG